MRIDSGDVIHMKLNEGGQWLDDRQVPLISNSLFLILDVLFDREGQG